MVFIKRELFNDPKFATGAMGSGCRGYGQERSRCTETGRPMEEDLTDGESLGSGEGG